MNFTTSSLLGITIFLVLLSFQSPIFAEDSEEKIFPDWIKQSVSIWVNDEISDSEFLALIENILENNILSSQIDTKQKVKNTAKTVVNEIPELYQKESYELIPNWVKDRAEWWIDGKISDIQFLRTIHYLREAGYLEYNAEKSIFSNNQTYQSSLEKFLLTEKEILDITKKTKWRILSTEYEFEEKEAVIDSVKLIFTDISRVYEPIFYKFKVPSLTMQISEFNNEEDLENYWNSFENRDKQTIFDSAYVTGNPNENSECMFNYTLEGAITSCSYDNLIFQVIIFDQHGEHFDYEQKNIIFDEEPTSSFSNEILKKISYYKNNNVNQLHHVFQQNLPETNLKDSTNLIQVVPKSIEPEKSAIQGIENFSCIRDDFGLVTISGQYNNDNAKRNKVELIISFLDNEGNSIGKTSTTFHNLQEFESKRFVGHSKWNENFSSCQINIG